MHMRREVIWGRGIDFFGGGYGFFSNDWVEGGSKTLLRFVVVILKVNHHHHHDNGVFVRAPLSFLLCHFNLSVCLYALGIRSLGFVWFQRIFFARMDTMRGKVVLGWMDILFGFWVSVLDLFSLLFYFTDYRSLTILFVFLYLLKEVF